MIGVELETDLGLKKKWLKIQVENKISELSG